MILCIVGTCLQTTAVTGHDSRTKPAPHGLKRYTEANIQTSSTELVVICNLTTLIKATSLVSTTHPFSSLLANKADCMIKNYTPNKQLFPYIYYVMT